MDILKSEKGYTENAVAVSRIHQEALEISRNNSIYGVIADLIGNNIEGIDRLAEWLGESVAEGAVRRKYDQQYFDPKYGKFKNFITRNIYISEDKKQRLEKERQLTGAAVMAGTELGVKMLAHGIQTWANERDKYELYRQGDSVLYCYTVTGAGGNNTGAAVELNKIRNSFQLSVSDRRKLQTNTSRAGIRSVADLDTPTIFESDNSLFLEDISYLLFSIASQKYGDLSENDAARRQLMDFYSYLGYSGSYANELLENNRERYDVISTDQVKYLKIAQGMVKNIFVEFPGIDQDRLVRRAQEMAAYDPYSLRRKKVTGGAKAGALTIGGIFAKSPELVINGAAAALSQFAMTDGLKDTAHDKLRSYGIDENLVQTIFDKGKKISDSAEEIK